MKTKRSDFPYTTHLNVLQKPLEVVDVQKLVQACTDKWYNQTLCRVNDSVVRLGIVEGEYHWHEHKELDEFFYVVDGHFLIDFHPHYRRAILVSPCSGHGFKFSSAIGSVVADLVTTGKTEFDLTLFRYR